VPLRKSYKDGVNSRSAAEQAEPAYRPVDNPSTWFTRLAARPTAPAYRSGPPNASVHGRADGLLGRPAGSAARPPGRGPGDPGQGRLAAQAGVEEVQGADLTGSDDAFQEGFEVGREVDQAVLMRHPA
jgi:hypothetical protein